MLTDRLIRWLGRPVSSAGINALVDLPIALASDVGLLREENQDRVAVMKINGAGGTQPCVVLALADGMGGMVNGAECATKALSAFFNALIRYRHAPFELRLNQAALIANEEVYNFAKGRGGATLSAVIVSVDDGAWTLNIGDSRIYSSISTKERDEVIRLTVDDSLEEAVGGHGKDLLQFIGMGEGLIPHVAPVPIHAQRVLLTSDGVHFLNHEVLVDTLLSAENSTLAAQQLMTLAKWHGAPDNASLAITYLPNLITALDERRESGIELWDSFSGLHVDLHRKLTHLAA